MPFLLKVQAPLGRFSRLGRLLDKTLTVLERWAFLANIRTVSGTGLRARPAQETQDLIGVEALGKPGAFCLLDGCEREPRREPVIWLAVLEGDHLGKPALNRALWY
jgi:hypothetical protein